MQATRQPKSTGPMARFSSLAMVLIAANMSTSCAGLPGDPRSQGAVIGGASGAAAGAIIAGEDNRLLGAIIGTVIGGGGGYVIGNELEKRSERDTREAAAKSNKTSSFTVQDVQGSNTADLDTDGNVTMAELVALKRAGLSDAEIIRRSEATNVVFDLNDEQKQTLRQSGVSGTVIDKLVTINRNKDRIGTPR